MLLFLQSQKWWTALFYAVGGNHAAVVQELVIAGASTTIKDKVCSYVFVMSPQVHTLATILCSSYACMI